MEPQTYVKVPGAIQAIQWLGDNAKDIQDWVGPDLFVLDSNGNAGIWVQANNSRISVEVGAWIALDQFGFYPIKSQIFKQNYQLSSDQKAPLPHTTLDDADPVLLKMMTWIMDEFGVSGVKSIAIQLYEKASHQQP